MSQHGDHPLLNTIITQQGETNRLLGEYGAKIDALRNELVGPSGKNGRVGKLEATVERLESERNIQSGLRRSVHYVINFLITLLTIFGYHRFAK